MKIILLGYMTSGKTTIGKIIAEKYKIEFIDLDHYIEKKEKMTISEIFDKRGEIYFRKIENHYLQEVLNSSKDYILSLGGGTPCYSNNMELISASKYISVYLRALPNTIVERLKNEKEKRPLVASLNDDELLEFVAKHLFERNYFYTKANHIQVIDNKDVKTVCNELFDFVCQLK